MATTDFNIGDHKFDIPVMASAMDAVVSPTFATLMHQAGGLGVLNLEGIYTRYEDPYAIPGGDNHGAPGGSDNLTSTVLL